MRRLVQILAPPEPSAAGILQPVEPEWGLLVLALVVILAFCQSLHAETPDQVARWRQAKVNPRWSLAADKAVALWMRTHGRYEGLALDVSGGAPGTTREARMLPVPPQIVFGFHGRESSWSFAYHLHEGSPLTHRTRDVPKGRIPGIEPPYSWEVSARDALYGYEHLERRNWTDLGSALQAMESYNGLGYQRSGKPASPYLWSGTTIYTRGKYVGDGRYSDEAVDRQLGICAILKRMKERGVKVPESFR